ncbi:hypothetical protein P8452_42351 [Trifolium repens]|nr:hypothetical protein P8452_42351 [Trifolium repens]
METLHFVFETLQVVEEPNEREKMKASKDGGYNTNLSEHVFRHKIGDGGVSLYGNDFSKDGLWWSRSSKNMVVGNS